MSSAKLFVFIIEPAPSSFLIIFDGTTSTVVLLLLLLAARIVLAFFIILLETMILLLEMMIIVLTSKLTVKGVTIVFVVTMPTTTRNMKMKSGTTLGSLFCLTHRTCAQSLRRRQQENWNNFYEYCKGEEYDKGYENADDRDNDNNNWFGFWDGEKGTTIVISQHIDLPFRISRLFWLHWQQGA